MSFVLSGFSRSVKISKGIFISIESSLRRVLAVGGLTAVFMWWWRGSENQCFGTRMYSIVRAGAVAFVRVPRCLRAFFFFAGRKS